MTNELHFFSNFFTEFYVLHPYGEKAQDNLSKEDRTRALVYSILLGTCSFGLVHLGCWVAERCFKPVDTTAENLKKQSSVAHQTMYKGEDLDARKEDPTGYTIREASQESKQKKTSKGPELKKETQKTEEKKNGDTSQKPSPDPLANPPTPDALITLWKGVPSLVKQSLNDIFGNDRIIDRLPLFSVTEEPNYWEDETVFNFPIMKGKIINPDDNKQQIPAIVIKVVPADAEAYFIRHKKDQCEEEVQNVVMKDASVNYDQEYALFKQQFIEEIKTQPKFIILRKEKTSCFSKTQNDYTWVEDDFRIRMAECPNFFTESLSDGLISMEGGVSAEKTRILKFQSLIAGNSATDLYGTQWKIFEYDKVQALLAK